MKRFKAILFTTLLSLLGTVAVFAQIKPFPQGLNYPGCIKPNHVTQATMNTAVGSYYDYWKGQHLKNNLSSLPGGYYVKGNITGSADGFTPLGSSEGQGYGMVITTLMAGYDANAKTIYDGLFKTARAFKSSANSNLMGWVVADASGAQGHFDSATDGDMDIAYSLILAHYQWGSTGSINYLEEAKKMITNGLKVSNVTSNNRLNLGDWDAKGSYDTRPSDWMLSHMRAFYNVTGDQTWLNVINNLYTVYNGFTSSYSSSTGLVTDFIVGNPAKPCPANFLDEYPETNTYSYNACRFPLRLVMDYALYGNTNSKTAAEKIATWIKGKASNNPANIKDGYKLDGTATGSYATAVFASPFIAAGVTNSNNQAWVNSGWDWMKSKKEDYYSDSYNMLSLIFISGNWWVPGGSVPSNQAPTVSLTAPSNNATYTAPASITLSANAADADGTVNKVEFYNGSTLLNSDATAPYSYTWTGVTAGTYTITAKATDNVGATTTSSAITVTVTNASDTQAPTVSLTAPANNSNVNAPATINITATASDNIGVTKVDFYNGTNLLNSDATTPYAYTWSGVGTGTYTITAKAYDAAGNNTTSSAVTVTVNTVVVTQSPYGGTAASIPGTVEAAKYDIGGQNIAYYDNTTGNAGSTFRTEDVDIETSTEGGYNIGWTAATEWTEYTVNVTAGTYKVEARVAATAAGKSFRIEMDGATVATIAVPNTGGWQTWQTVTVNNVTLSGGQKIMRIYNITDGFNVSTVKFSAASTTNIAPTVSLTAPSNNATYTAPASITLSANASDADGTVSKVEFYNGSALLNSDAITPYSYTWTGVAAGTYTITAKATDNAGAVITSTAVTVTVTNPTTNTGTKVIGYAPTWINFPGIVNTVDLSKLTHINIAFANPNSSGQLTGVNLTDLATVVTKAHANNVKVLMSIGGAGAGGQSANYRTLLGNTTNMNNFVNSLVTYAVNNNLDGIDVDIEGDLLDGSTITSSQYQTFVTALATGLHAQNKIMTAALATWFANYVTNTAAAQFDFINVMSYDAAIPGTGDGAAQHSSYQLAVDDFNYWKNTKGVAASKLTVGLPFYGYGWGSYAVSGNDEIAYSTIVNTYTGAENKDVVGSGSNAIYYNGIPTVKQKTTFAKENAGGIMIWELAEDVTDSRSLLLAIDQVIHSGTTNQAPTVSLTSPANNATFTAPGAISISANASDADGSISKVEFYNGSTLLNSDATAPYAYTWSGLTAGTYTITAKATDNAGATTTSSVATVTVTNPTTDTQAPTVSLTAPLNNATYNAPASISITANASDNVGVTKVEFYNGATLLNTDNSSPYSYAWSNVSAGTYTIVAKAYDAANNTTTSSSVTITVNTVTTGGCTGISQYVENNGYVAGSKVQNSGSQYECKPYPYSGWCNGAAWAYGPGTGAYWTDAWTLVGSCNARSSADNATQGTVNENALSNSPNPFASVTTINVTLTEASDVNMKVYNKAGQVVATIFEGHLAAGSHRLEFDSNSLIPDMYIVKCNTNSSVTTRKIIKN